ncbi:MAG: hypothetical protein MJY89_08050, partial [Bacteroidales bacterium]|nr:hypothetical protein [Bacteroidales bacterium]
KARKSGIFSLSLQKITQKRENQAFFRSFSKKSPKNAKNRHFFALSPKNHTKARKTGIFSLSLQKITQKRENQAFFRSFSK